MTQFPYVTETLALLGDQDPLTVLTETPAWIAGRVQGLPLPTLRKPESPGKWSLAEVFAHITDAEIAFSWRMRTLITQENPPLPGFDQGKWLTRFDYVNADPAQALQTFIALRTWNLRVWRTVTPEEFARVGQHPERGPESLKRVQQMTAGHDLRHRRQIDRIIAAVR